MFFPWYKFPEYTMPVPDSRLITLQTDKDERYGDEKGLVQEYKYTSGQVYWRRLKVDEFKGDLGQFAEKYPANAEEAFQSSGRPVFSPAAVKRQESMCMKGSYYLYDDEGVRFGVEQTMDSWHIIHTPEPDHQYCIGVDTCEGRLSDANDAKSKPDYHGVAVFDRTTRQFVAVYRGSCEQVTLGEQVYHAGIEYNNAWIAPELPNGSVVLNYLKDNTYPSIYQRQKGTESDNTTDSDLLGWRTTVVTRPYLVNNMIGVMRDGDVIFGFKEIINEMRTFVYDKNGKPGHMSGRHDDLLFGCMIAIQQHLEMPYNPTPYAYSSTDSDNYDIGDPRSLCRVGAFDTWKPGDEKDAEMEYTE